MLALRDSTGASGDSSVYTTSSPALELGKSLSVPSDSGTIKDVARLSWYLHVGPLVVTIVVSLFESGDIAYSSHFPTGSWDFVTGLYYEWDVIRGRQTYRWTIWIYLIARWATIAVVILILISLNVTSQINCQAWVWTSWSFAFLGLSTGSLLLVLRIFAIWNRNKGIAAIVGAIWATNATLLLLGVVRIRSVWEPVAKSCVVTNVDICKLSIVCCLVSDTILLLIMLAGLLRLRRGGRGAYELWHLLWKQGVIWFVVATVAEFPPAVFMVLNVNDVLDMMFLFPSIIMTVIATTRMYRSLQYFGPSNNTAPDSNSNDDQKTRNSRLVLKPKNASVIRIPSNRLEVTVHTAYEEYPMSQMNHCGPYPDKPREVDIDDKVEDCEAAA